MTALTFLRQAAHRVNRARRLWLVYYLLTLLFALAAALPLAALLTGNLGRTLWAGRMLENFDISWFTEFAYESGGWPVASYAPAAVVIAGVFFMLATFLAGGTIAVFASGQDRYDAGAFWGGCGRNFARLLRLAVPVGLTYAAAFVVYLIMRGLGESLFWDSEREAPLVLYAWFRTATTLALMLLISMTAGYARVRLVVEDSRRALRAYLESFVFVFRSFRAAAGVYAGAMLLLAILAAVGHFSINRIPQTTIGWLLVMLAAQQVFILARISVKLLLYAGETGVYQALRKAPAPPPEQERDAAGEPVPEQAVSQQHAPDTAAALAGGEQWDAAPADEFSAQPGEPGPPPAR
jgi:uncharacterized membrane protein